MCKQALPSRQGQCELHLGFWTTYISSPSCISLPFINQVCAVPTAVKGQGGSLKHLQESGGVLESNKKTKQNKKTTVRGQGGSWKHLQESGGASNHKRTPPNPLPPRHPYLLQIFLVTLPHIWGYYCHPYLSQIFLVELPHIWGYYWHPRS